MNDATQIAGPSSRISEREMARLGCAPFLPARQPKIFLVGLGLGEVLVGVAESLRQKRATFHIAEPTPEIVAWNRKYFPDHIFATDPRIELHSEVSPAELKKFDATLHAILVHSDTAPFAPDGGSLFENPRWLSAAYDALQEGGLLAIGSSSKISGVRRKLEQSGFVVACHEIDVLPNARRPKHHFLWLGRKGQFSDYPN